jgi:hypothetical protein
MRWIEPEPVATRQAVGLLAYEPPPPRDDATDAALIRVVLWGGILYAASALASLAARVGFSYLDLRVMSALTAAQNAVVVTCLAAILFASAGALRRRLSSVAAGRLVLIAAVVLAAAFLLVEISATRQAARLNLPRPATTIAAEFASTIQRFVLPTVMVLALTRNHNIDVSRLITLGAIASCGLTAVSHLLPYLHYLAYSRLARQPLILIAITKGMVATAIIVILCWLMRNGRSIPFRWSIVVMPLPLLEVANVLLIVRYLELEGTSWGLWFAGELLYAVHDYILTLVFVTASLVQSQLSKITGVRGR